MSAKIKRNKRIIELREKGITFQKIGEELGFSRQRAHKLYSEIQKQNAQIVTLRNQGLSLGKIGKLFNLTYKEAHAIYKRDKGKYNATE